MLKSTKYEKDMLAGAHGKLKQQAIKKVVDYAKILNATELCEVTMAHLFCGGHHYLDAAGSDNIAETIAQMHYCTHDILPQEEFVCYCQADSGPLDPAHYLKMNATEEEAQHNNDFLTYFQKQGVNLTGTCVPYLCGFVPLRGEHFVSSESHAVTLMNSLWGAAGNADGLEAGFWAAACGRIPKWGNHIAENRKGTHVFNICCTMKSSRDWDLLGYTIGRFLPTHSIPVITGLSDRPDIVKLKYFFAAMATTAGPEMCHIVGITPEATQIEAALGGEKPKAIRDISSIDIEKSYDILNSKQQNGKLDYVSLGCPHYSIEELRKIAKLLRGKKIAKNTILHIWTAGPIKETADRSGYTKDIEASGAHLLTSTCPLLSGKMPKGCQTAAFDSAKQAHYLKAEGKANICYGTMEKCIQSAISGKWEVAPWEE